MGIFTFKNIFSDVAISGLTESVLPPLILNMTITGSVVILFVLLARLALKKAPKIFSYALWAVVLFRLLCPVSITTDFSLLGLFDTPAVENTQHTTAVEYIPYDVVHTPELEVQLPVPPIVNEAVNHALPQEHAALGADPLEGEVAIGSFIWLLGIGAMAVYSMVSYILLRRKLVGAVLLRDNIYLADGIDSPFVMGLIRPKIYLPSALSEQEQGYIILHEQHHIRRGDHLVKALAFIALCIHWFNPLVWVAFILSSKDMEMSCDEAVVKKLGEDIRADYSASLLSLATGRRIIAGTPLAFGEGDTKSRIKNMLSWKKPKVWLVAAATLAVVAVVVFCGTNADKRSTVEVRQTENGHSVALTLHRPVRSFAIYEEVYQDGRLISGTPILLDGFSEDDWSRMPRKCELALYSTVGFDGAMTASCVMDGSEIVWDTELPEDAYTEIRHIVGTGNVEGTLSKDNHSIDAGDDVILLSVVLSTAPDGEICVYRNGWSLAKGNDTVVQYRLVTSTETAEAFEDMPLDLAQTLYDLRVETLNDPDDMGAQAALRILLDTMGASEFGDYELQYYDMSSKEQISTLKLAGEFWPGGSGQRPPYEKTGLCIWYSDVLGEKEASAFAEANKGVVELLLALVPDLDEVMIGYPIEGGAAGYIGASDKDASYVKDRLGYKDMEELGQSAAGIRTLMEFFGWPAASLGTGEALGGYGTVTDISYYLELAVGESFRYVSVNRQFGILAEYEGLLDDYTLIVRETEDGKTAYIVGQYNGNPTESPLYGMYSIGGSVGEEEWNLLYREEDSAAVDAALTAGKIPDVGYLIDKSYIRWSSDNGLILIQPKDTEIVLDVPWSRYLHTPNGREYITDAVSRGIDVCGRTDTFLYVYLISERFGEIAERIALTEAEAQAILAEERVNITDGFGFSATLHIGDQTTYFNEREGAPQSVIDLAVEKCRYRFESPDAITGDIVEATLDMAALDTTLHAEKSDLPRLKEILTNAEFGYVGSCGYGAKLTLTLSNGEKLVAFKGCDGCDTIVFGSYGGYFIGEQENIEFWEMFGLDPETKDPIDSTYEPKTFVSAFIQAEDVGDLLNSFTPWDLYYDLDTYEYTDTDPLSCYVYYHLTRPQFESFRTAFEERLGGMPDEIRIDGNWDETGGDPRDVAYITVSGPCSRAEIEELVAVVRQSQGLPPIHPMEEQEQLPEAPPSETDIHNALMSNYTVLHDESEATRPYRTEAHHIWDVHQDGTTANVYALVNFTTYGWDNGRQKRIAWWDGPAKLTFTWSDGWQLTDFWRWTEDEQYETAIQDRFPADVAAIALGPMDSDISASMNTHTYEAAAAYYATQSGLSVYQPFTPADVEFTGQALYTFVDTMSYEERLEWARIEGDFTGSVNLVSGGICMEEQGFIAYVEKWAGRGQFDENLVLRFPDGTQASLPLPRESANDDTMPNSMEFESGKFIYEITFPTQEVTNEGETLIHLKGTYHYEVDLVAKTVSLTVLQ